MTASDLDLGVRNLLLNCAQVSSGGSVLIVHEAPDLGWYDREAPEAVAKMAGTLGLDVTMLPVGAPTAGRYPGVEDAVAAHDTTIFFARIGDQNRFEEFDSRSVRVMSYARNANALASAYGRTHHRAMVVLKEAVNDILLSADRIRISCPLGTDYIGSVDSTAREEISDVAVRRFPLGVPQPISVADFSGRVALAGYLTPSGSRAYEPANLRIDGCVIAQVDGHRIVDFDGPKDDVTRVRSHYAHVADLFGIERDFVHSWHAGIHPGCTYEFKVADDPDRWSNNVFTHPRFLHFHTCGAYAPGEICWMVLDPTVDVDGLTLWDRGQLRPTLFERGRQCLLEWPELDVLFAAPSTPIGIDPALPSLKS